MVAYEDLTIPFQTGVKGFGLVFITTAVFELLVQPTDKMS